MKSIFTRFVALYYTLFHNQLSSKSSSKCRFGMLVMVAVAGKALLDFFCCCRVPVSGDEAYYWMWSKNLATGYFDHPPMVAWLIAAGTAIVGDTPQGIRLMAVVFSAMSALFLYAFSRRIGGSDTAAFGSLILCMCVPFMAVGSVMMTPDTGLFFFWTLTVIFSYDAFLGSGKVISWACAGLFWACAFMSKFMALLFLPSLLFFLILSPRGRQSLSLGKSLIAAGTALLCLIPYFTWNVAHGWASLNFQLLARHTALSSFTPHTGSYLLLQGVALSPLMAIFFVYVLWRALTMPPSELSPDKKDKYCYLAAISFTTYMFFLAVSFFEPVEMNWTIVGIPGLIVLAPYILLDDLHDETRRKRSQFLALSAFIVSLALTAVIYAAGLSPSAVMAVTSSMAPGNGLTLHYGYPDISRHIENLRKSCKEDFFVATESNGLSAAITYHTGNFAHMCYGNLQGREYREWESRYNMRGKNALFVGFEPYGSRYDVETMLSCSFREVKPLKPWNLTREGRVCGTLYPVYCRSLAAPGIFFTGNLQGSKRMNRAAERQALTGIQD
ncbi:MAG: ArnT family glycosyltransferase [Candidatus Xenobiia bacterium LiM19]